MKKLYLLSINLLFAYFTNAQSSCNTALTVSDGVNTIPSTTDTSYWYKFTTSEDPVKLVIDAPDGTYINVSYNNCETQVFADDDYNGNITIIEPNTLRDYFIRIETDGGDFEWSFSELPLTAGDKCDLAVTANSGVNQLPATTNEYYYYTYSVTESDKKLVVGSTSNKLVTLYKNSCSTSDYIIADLSSATATGLEVGDNLLIEWKIDSEGDFDWNISSEDLAAGETCGLAIEAQEVSDGGNSIPNTDASVYWYTFTMPDVQNARVSFDFPYQVSVKAFEGICSNFTNDFNVSNFGSYTTSFQANKQYYFRFEMNGQAAFNWDIKVEVPVLGQDCNNPNIAEIGLNTLPTTNLDTYWYKYTTPLEVSGKKLQANVKDGVEMILTKNGCGNSNIVQRRDSSVFALDLEPETNYFFRFNNIEGGDFDWELLLTEPVSGDLCADPIQIDEGQHKADFTPQWFSFTAIEDGTYEISSTVETSDKDTILKLFDTCGGSVRSENDDASSSTYQSEITLDLVANETILILWESDQFDTNDGFDWTVYNTSRQQITFNPLTERTFGDDSFELSASSTSGLDVSYSSSNTNVATIDGATVSIIGAGQTIITASQSGNADFDAAIPVERTLIVNKADQTISITEISDKFTTDAAFEIEASTTSELALSYEISGPASLEGNTITLEGTVGTVEVTVSQAGNENFNPASVTISFEVREDPCLNFEVTATATNLNCAGEADGNLSVETTAGTAPFTYSLDGAAGVEENVFSNLAAGEYTIAVTDANGCTATATATISSPDALEITAEVENSNSINGNGSISLTVSGGSGEYSYSWSNGSTTANLTDLAVGEYTVTVSDQNECSLEESFTIGGVTANNELIGDGLLLYPNPAHEIIKVQHPANAGLLKLYDARGKLLNEVMTEGNQSEVSISNLPSGLYFMSTAKSTQLYRFIKE
jgi:hypothetical protein